MSGDVIVRGVTDLTPSAKEFLVWCVDDYTEAFVLRDVLRRVDPPASPEDERAKAMATLEELIVSGLVRVGDMVATVPGLRYWDDLPAEILARIAAAWDVASPPEMGHGPWFHASDAGKVAAQ